LCFFLSWQHTAAAAAVCRTLARSLTQQKTLSQNNKNNNHHSNRFILRILDDTHVWIKSDRLDWVLHEVRVFNEANVYTPPIVLGGGGEGDEGDDEDEDDEE
jgi:hypothetical protein